MWKPRLLLITHSFPFGEAEKTFLAPEVSIIERYFDLSIVSRNIYDEQTTEISPNLQIFRYNPQEQYSPLSLILASLFSEDFWKECLFLLKRKKLDIFCFKQALSVHMRTTHFKKYLERVIPRDDQPMVFYTYWNGYETYACQKVRKKQDLVITRTHGGDLYLKVDNHNYQPYKDQMNRNIDRIYFISQDGLYYYKNNFAKLKDSQLTVARLGTFSNGFQNELRVGDGIIRLFTLSRLYWVKRIDKLIKTLGDINDIRIEWTHIGDGELHGEIHKMATEVLDKKENITYRFVGNLKNEDVFKYLREHPMDFIVNTSYSEGLPVSIIEAMSCGIPAVAVNVGGMSEIIINGKNGYLLDRDFSSKEFYSVLSDYASMSEDKKQRMRANAYGVWNEQYNAENNHQMFAEDVLSLLGDRNEENQ